VNIYIHKARILNVTSHQFAIVDHVDIVLSIRSCYFFITADFF